MSFRSVLIATTVLAAWSAGAAAEAIKVGVTAGPHEGKTYVFERHDTFVVGRSSQVKFPVPEDKFLSRDHFLIEFNPPVCFLKDMGSTNGTKASTAKNPPL